MYTLNSALRYFMRNDWIFHDDNLENMYQSLSPTDRIIFNCNIKELSWDRQIIVMAIGTRKYVIKDGLKNTIYGRKKYYILRIIHYVITPLYLYLLWKVFTLCLFFICSVFSFLLKYFMCS